MRREVSLLVLCLLLVPAVIAVPAGGPPATPGGPGTSADGQTTSDQNTSSQETNDAPESPGQPPEFATRQDIQQLQADLERQLEDNQQPTQPSKDITSLRNTVLIGGAILLLLVLTNTGLIIYFLFLKKDKPNAQLVAYAKKCQQLGYSKQQIRARLQKSGYSQQEINALEL